MLKRLRIQNFILIDQLDLPILAGMTAMTGETGAGKSILLGALGAALGQRLSAKAVLKDKGAKAIIELELTLPKHLEAEFQSKDIDFDEHSVFRRELLPNGKSRAFINDTPVKSSDLAYFAGQFIDINSQSDSGLLTDVAKQIELIDSFVAADAEREEYNKIYTALKAILIEQKLLIEQADTSDLDYLEFLYHELDKANVKPGEYEEIEELIRLNKNASDFNEQYNELATLIGGESNLLDQLFTVESKLARLATKDPSTEQLLEKLLEIISHTQAIEREILNRIAAAELTVDVDALIDRKHQIDGLIRKHRVIDAEALVVKFDALGAQIKSIKDKDSLLKQLKAEQINLEAALKTAGTKLHARRLESTQFIQNALIGYLSDVDLPKAKIELIWQEQSPTAVGLYKPQFMFSANPGSPLEPLNKVASGGEQSRVKLALKAALGKHVTLSCQVFDEIDTGISGATAEKVGNLMSELAERQQIITITHLPQVASKGTTHWLISKTSTDTTTESSVNVLTDEARVDELARMLSGAKITQAAKNQAEALLKAR
ncbi:MAG: AAA family ATPase [Flavobacteriaceae bacterium]|nr:AAA family ATPase [Flavobacteriaceae bacterium]